MLNQLIYGGICFISGCCIGGAIVGHFVAKDAKKQIDEADKRNKALVDEVVRLRDANIEKREAKIEAEERKIKDNIDSLRKDYSKAVDLDDLDSIEDDLCLDNYDIPSNETKVEKVISYVDEEEPDDKIRLVSKDLHDIILNNTDVRTEKLKYYQPNGYLIDEDNEIITYEDQIIGVDAMDIIDDTKNDYLYVHDSANETLYEIEIEHDEMYTRDLAGAHV